MTQKLYETNSYIKEFTATVLSCTEQNGRFLATLDKTAFFPEGGGQAPDKGVLNNIEVLDVQEMGDSVVHTLEKPLEVGTKVIGQIDWALRFSRMQNHCAEHILSGVIHKLFGFNNVGFHMNDSLVTFDISGTLTAEDIERVEHEANRAVFENAEIVAFYPTAEEFETLNCRSKIELKEGVRLVHIKGFDTCACCAPHPGRAGEIGLIKIVNFYSFKGGTRIEMVAGALALSDYSYLHNAAKSIMKQLSAKREEIATAVEKLGADLSAARFENKGLLEKLATANLKTERVGESLVGFTENADFGTLRNIATPLCKNSKIVALFSKMPDNTFNYLLASQNENLTETTKQLNLAFAGKGGGKPNSTQGKISAESQSEVLNFIKHKI